MSRLMLLISLLVFALVGCNEDLATGSKKDNTQDTAASEIVVDAGTVTNGKPSGAWIDQQNSLAIVVIENDSLMYITYNAIDSSVIYTDPMPYAGFESLITMNGDTSFTYSMMTFIPYTGSIPHPSWAIASDDEPVTDTVITGGTDTTGDTTGNSGTVTGEWYNSTYITVKFSYEFQGESESEFVPAEEADIVSFNANTATSYYFDGVEMVSETMAMSFTEDSVLTDEMAAAYYFLGDTLVNAVDFDGIIVEMYMVPYTGSIPHPAWGTGGVVDTLPWDSVIIDTVWDTTGWDTTFIDTGIVVDPSAEKIEGRFLVTEAEYMGEVMEFTEAEYIIWDFSGNTLNEYSVGGESSYDLEYTSDSTFVLEGYEYGFTISGNTLSVIDEDMSINATAYSGSVDYPGWRSANYVTRAVSRAASSNRSLFRK